jgi:hypothetical protein
MRNALRCGTASILAHQTPRLAMLAAILRASSADCYGQQALVLSIAGVTAIMLIESLILLILY